MIESVTELAGGPGHHNITQSFMTALISSDVQTKELPGPIADSVKTLKKVMLDAGNLRIAVACTIQAVGSVNTLTKQS
jgi:hypothetical protein